MKKKSKRRFSRKFKRKFKRSTHSMAKRKGKGRGRSSGFRGKLGFFRKFAGPLAALGLADIADDVANYFGATQYSQWVRLGAGYAADGFTGLLAVGAKDILVGQKFALGSPAAEVSGDAI